MSPVRTAEITADHIGADLIDHIKAAALVIKYHIAAPGRSAVGIARVTRCRQDRVRADGQLARRQLFSVCQTDLAVFFPLAESVKGQIPDPVFFEQIGRADMPIL